MDKRNPSKIDLERSLKPAGSYLDSLSGFADLLGTIRQAEDAAKELLEEASPQTGVGSGSQTQAEKTHDGSSAGQPPLSPESAHPGSSAEDSCAKPLIEAGAAEPDAGVSDEQAGSGGRSTEELLEQLDSLVGLSNIKQSVKSLINYVKVRKLRKEKELPNPPLSLHMVFTGNPGTGKTTVARILAELYRAIGVLSKGQLVEVDRSGLVAGFVGQTALKTTEAVNSALGGILFIDEAYALAPDTGGANDFGREAIETLLKMMEDHRDDLIIIVAGYSGPMERFIGANPGLESRFNRYFTFEDYNSGQLYEIFSSMCAKSEYILKEDAREFAMEHFEAIYETRDECFGNARHVRNFFENIVAVQSDRVSALEEHTRDALAEVVCEDLRKAALA